MPPLAAIALACALLGACRPHPEPRGRDTTDRTSKNTDASANANADADANANANADADASANANADASADANATATAPAPARPAARPLPTDARLVAPLRAAGARGFVAMTNGERRVVAPVARGASVDADRPVFIASFTKLWVSVAALRMVARGEISLDTKIRDVLPELASRPWADSPLRELLTHTSTVPAFDDARTGFFRKPVDLTDPVKVLATYVPAGWKEKRGVYKYRNAEVAIAGVMLATKAHTTLGDVLAREVFVPAKMSHSGLLVGAPPPGLDMATMGGVRPQNFLGAGAGYASPNDLLAFFDALDAGVLLDAEGSARLFDGSPSRGDGAFGCWVYPFAGPSGEATRLVERTGTLGNVRLFSAYFPDEHRAIVAWNGDGVRIARPRAGPGIGRDLSRLALE